MNPRHTLKIIFVAALGALAVFVLPALAGAKGSRDRDTTGTITAFDASSGQLTITQDGDSFTARVDRRTKIRCEDQSGDGRRGRVAARRSGESEPGDDHGGHGNEVGDDHGGRGAEPGDGGHGEEAGDDNGGESSGPGRGGHDDNGAGANCTSADLSVGAAVHEAELELEHGRASWDEIELAG
ncbi:MAG TPA: hypothetical protein VHA54_02465 [Solirubrobacterales bacterium]|nr:hypothetical protein [Solirubrobacterales bacterium]